MAARKKKPAPIPSTAPVAPRSEADTARLRELERELYGLAGDPTQAEQFERVRLVLDELRHS